MNKADMRPVVFGGVKSYDVEFCLLPGGWYREYKVRSGVIQ